LAISEKVREVGRRRRSFAAMGEEVRVARQAEEARRVRRSVDAVRERRRSILERARV
jgi:hypothetical protein